MWEQLFAAGQFLQQMVLLLNNLAEVSWPGDCREELLPYLALSLSIIQGEKQHCPSTVAFSKPISILTSPGLYVVLISAAIPHSHTIYIALHCFPLHLPEGGSYLKKQLSKHFRSTPLSLLQANGGQHSVLHYD